MGVIDATLKLVMVMVVVVVMMMMTTMMMTTTMTMMGMMLMLLIKKEVCVLQFNRPMSIYLHSYLAPEGLGNETKEIVLRLSNG